MNPHVRDNQADNETIGGIREPDGTIIMSVCPAGSDDRCEWVEIARWEPDGNVTHADGVNGATWTLARIATAEQVMRSIE